MLEPRLLIKNLLASKSLCWLLLSMAVFLTVVCQPSSAFAAPCPTCGGTGKVTCPACGGSGVTPGPILGGIRSYYGCGKCGGGGGGGSPGSKGSGKVRCPTCGGTGEVAGSGGGAGQNTTPDDSAEKAAAAALEAQRQKQREEDRKREEEAAQKKRDDFEKAKNAALNDLKGIGDNLSDTKGAGNDMGLKGIDDPKPENKAKDLGLKGIDDGGMTFNKVTPSPLEVDKGILVYPALNNDNYKKGYDALRGMDIDSALRFFEQARKELPNDSMVRDALQMARIMVRTRQERESAVMQLMGGKTPAPGEEMDDLRKFLFPDDKPRPFPANPEKPLLNPMIEQKKAVSLPNRAETVDDFVARLTKSEFYAKIDKVSSEQIKPWSTDPVYPRGKYPEVDKVVDETIRQISQRRTSGLHDACSKAAQEMNAEWAKMERAGKIKPGEDLARREAVDADYQTDMMPIRHRVYEQLGRDMGDVLLRNQVALDRLKERIPEMQKQAWDAQSDVVKYLFPAEQP